MTVILIGGSPRSGKTSIGKLFKENGYEHIEFDIFKHFLKNSVKDSNSINKLWFYTSGSIWDAEDSIEKICQHYLDTGKLMDPGFKSVFEKINMESDILIESTYLFPKQLFEFKQTWPDARIICTGIDDLPSAVKCITEGFNNNPEDWIHRIGDKHLEKVIAVVSMLSRWIQAECKKYTIEYIPYGIPRDMWLEKTYQQIIRTSSK